MSKAHQLDNSEKKAILAVYDITGIQDFIFSSKKLKDNIGASFLITKALRRFFHKALKETDEHSLIEWEPKQPKEETNNLAKQTNPHWVFNGSHPEIIYIGGGNAMAVFPSKDSYIKTNKAFSNKILIETAGRLQFATQYIDTDFTDFNNDRKKLFRKLKTYKSGKLPSLPLGGISITRAGDYDGLPAQLRDKGSLISLAEKKKRDANDESKQYYYDKFISNNSKIEEKEFAFPDELDDLTAKGKQLSWAAVVHIDGNNMGDTLNSIFNNSIFNDSQKMSYETAVPLMREFSFKTAEVYERAMQDLTEKMCNLVCDPEKSKPLPKTYDGHKLFLPLRPIIQDGDDVTFICNEAVAISAVETFLKYVYEHPITINETKISLSACAGIAFIKPHFPFYRAYQLAENLCKEAKAKGKIINEQIGGASRNRMGCWFDFHYVMSGVTTDSIDSLRAYHYNTPGMDVPLAISSGGKEFTCHNLLWRPWLITGEVSDDYEKFRWEYGKKILADFTKIYDKTNDDEINKPKWPRSKLKALRNAFSKSKEEVNTLISEFESRKLRLPGVNDRNEGEAFIERMTPYLDIIEIMDNYLEL